MSFVADELRVRYYLHTMRMNEQVAHEHNNVPCALRNVVKGRLVAADTILKINSALVRSIKS